MDTEMLSLDKEELLDIEYGDYQNCNQVSFDNEMIKIWLNDIPINMSDLSVSETFGLVEALLFEGEYMPFISRNSNTKIIGHECVGSPTQHYKYIHESLNIKSGKNKIYLNNKDVTEKLRKRYDKFLKLCNELKEKNELGSIWYYWKGEKL